MLFVWGLWWRVMKMRMSVYIQFFMILVSSGRRHDLQRVRYYMIILSALQPPSKQNNLVQWSAVHLISLKWSSVRCRKVWVGALQDPSSVCGWKQDGLLKSSSGVGLQKSDSPPSPFTVDCHCHTFYPALENVTIELSQKLSSFSPIYQCTAEGEKSLCWRVFSPLHLTRKQSFHCHQDLRPLLIEDSEELIWWPLTLIDHL